MGSAGGAEGLEGLSRGVEWEAEEGEGRGGKANHSGRISSDLCGSGRFCGHVSNGLPRWGVMLGGNARGNVRKRVYAWCMGRCEVLGSLARLNGERITQLGDSAGIGRSSEDGYMVCKRLALADEKEQAAWLEERVDSGFFLPYRAYISDMCVHLRIDRNSYMETVLARALQIRDSLDACLP